MTIEELEKKVLELQLEIMQLRLQQPVQYIPYVVHYPTYPQQPYWNWPDYRTHPWMTFCDRITAGSGYGSGGSANNYQ